MIIDQISLDDIRIFAVVAEQGSFTSAAELLKVSRSHISRRVSALEKQTGLTLLQRTTRTLKLTDSGKRLVAQCHSAIQKIEYALVDAINDNDNLKGNIRVNSVGGYLGEVYVASLVSEFMKLHPEVSVELDFSSHRVDLINDEFDVAFRMGKLEDSGFVARQLCMIEMCTLASPNYLTGKPVIKHPKELQMHCCLTGSVAHWRYLHHQTNESYSVSIDGTLRCKNGQVLISGALNGLGIIRVPRIYCQNAIDEGKLVEVFTEWHIPSVEFSLLYHKDKHQAKRLAAFIEFTKAYFLNT
ncbi:MULTISPECIES: LysR family transcriptional regulator [Pseudoalteromonas]|uniref:LysR family transcriptional regulator n=1 Tax=Pseudoalteromonas TaxID=53246 RepID=UPI002074C032|nr:MULTISPECIES: LysR family transcriptional regulator [Pseudoalteromonas]MDW7548888.1 LysR family transcriptional regulator [Pseudoalteromonas peptidolytica]